MVGFFGLRLGMMILKVFSNLNVSMILWPKCNLACTYKYTLFPDGNILFRRPDFILAQTAPASKKLTFFIKQHLCYSPSTAQHWNCVPESAFLGRKNHPGYAYFCQCSFPHLTVLLRQEQPIGHAKRAFCNQLLSIREVWAELMSLTGMNCLFPCSNSPVANEMQSCISAGFASPSRCLSSAQAAELEWLGLEACKVCCAR